MLFFLVECVSRDLSFWCCLCLLFLFFFWVCCVFRLRLKILDMKWTKLHTSTIRHTFITCVCVCMTVFFFLRFLLCTRAMHVFVLYLCNKFCIHFVDFYMAVCFMCKQNLNEEIFLFIFLFLQRFKESKCLFIDIVSLFNKKFYLEASKMEKKWKNCNSKWESNQRKEKKT